MWCYQWNSSYMYTSVYAFLVKYNVVLFSAFPPLSVSSTICSIEIGLAHSLIHVCTWQHVLHIYLPWVWSGNENCELCGLGIKLCGNGMSWMNSNMYRLLHYAYVLCCFRNLGKPRWFCNITITYKRADSRHSAISDLEFGVIKNQPMKSLLLCIMCLRILATCIFVETSMKSQLYCMVENKLSTDSSIQCS